MRIYTHIEYKWSNGAYKLDYDKSIWYDYNGPIELACGATQEQKSALQTQQGITSTIQSQLSQVFGESSNVFQDLYNTFAPVVNAGPNQQGFSPGEKSALDSQAITNTANQFQAAKQAVGERTAALGGGNIFMPSGAQIGPQLQLSQKQAEATSSELNNINLADYQTGRQNWLSAASGLRGSTEVFNPAISEGADWINAGKSQADQANQIAQTQNSWVNGLIGAGAQIAGSYLSTLG